MQQPASTLIIPMTYFVIVLAFIKSSEIKLTVLSISLKLMSRGQDWSKRPIQGRKKGIVGY